MEKTNEMVALIKEKADLQARLKLIPYQGTVEIKANKDKKYLYVRERTLGKLRSTYVGVYSEELHTLLLKQTKDAKSIKKGIKKIEKQLAQLGYEEGALSSTVIQNIDFARANMKSNIYDQAVLEGVATSFPQTEEIIDNGQVNGMTATDVQKILNLKHAWEFILDQDVIMSRTDLAILCYIARLVNEGFFYEGGKIRSVPVTIGGSSYVPPIPHEADVREALQAILNSPAAPIDTAIQLCLYCMKAQLFLDGNKRTAIIFANHYLIAHGGGFLVIPEKHVPPFKKHLVDYYEGKDPIIITTFIKENCWKPLPIEE